jgi:hypothetical protein
MKMVWDLRVLTDEEHERDEFWRTQMASEEAWRRLEVQLCEDERRGHNWWLDLDPSDDSITLRCLHCPAGIDDVCPDGHDLMIGEFEVCPDYVLSLNFSSVWVNGEDREGFMFGWRGPVTVAVRTEKYTSMDWIGYEYDVWVEVDPL